MTRAELQEAMATRPPTFVTVYAPWCAPTAGSPALQCRAEGHWGAPIYGAQGSRDVTHEGTWVSSNPGVIAIGRPGEIVAVGPPGESVVTFTLDRQRGELRFRVLPGDRPAVVLPFSNGLIRVAGTLPSVRIPGVDLEVISGRNAGMRVTTTEQGAFEFRPWVCGPATIRVTKPGYSTMEFSRHTCEGMDWTIGSIEMVPLPSS